MEDIEKKVDALLEHFSRDFEGLELDFNFNEISAHSLREEKVEKWDFDVLANAPKKNAKYIVSEKGSWI
jgi:Asp-tRNA(Asn)/Glu-tRNA(Gln) amidotransferase C subunit